MRKSNYIAQLSVLLASLCAVGLLLSGATRAHAAGTPEVADFHFFESPPYAHDFKMGLPNGSTLTLSDLRGKVVLLNFWRKDCQFCELEKGQLKSMLQFLRTDDVKVVCCNFWDHPSWVKHYAEQNGRNLLIASRPDNREAVVENVVKGRTMGYYIVNEDNEAIYEIKGFPSTYVIDADGKVVAAHLGLAQWSAPPILNWLAGLLGPEKTVDFASVDYDLPLWLHRLLSNSIGATQADNRSGARVQVVPRLNLPAENGR